MGCRLSHIVREKIMNLKEAIAKKKLGQFIKERLNQTGDKPKFDAAISSMAGKSKEAPAASKKDSDES
jgi:hypothetical protein